MVFVGILILPTAVPAAANAAAETAKGGSVTLNHNELRQLVNRDQPRARRGSQTRRRSGAGGDEL